MSTVKGPLTRLSLTIVHMTFMKPTTEYRHVVFFGIPEP